MIYLAYRFCEASSHMSYRKVQVGKDQEKAQSEEIRLSCFGRMVLTHFETQIKIIVDHSSQIYRKHKS